MTLRGMENLFLLKLPFWVKRDAAMQPRLFARVSVGVQCNTLASDFAQ